MALSDDQVRERLAALDRFKQEAAKSHMQTWDMIVNVSGVLVGKFEDWPSHIKEPILRAIERDCVPEKPGYVAKIVASGCVRDAPSEPAYIRVIVQEFPPIVRL